jgi:hypothetical protein
LIPLSLPEGEGDKGFNGYGRPSATASMFKHSPSMVGVLCFLEIDGLIRGIILVISTLCWMDRK